MAASSKFEVVVAQAEEGEEVNGTAEPQPILVRCRRFQVQVTFDPFGGLSPLEEHLLLDIATGEGSVDVLAGSLGLPKRLVLDACVDLLRAGMLVVKKGKLEVSALVRKKIGADPLRPPKGWARGFASAAPPEPEFVVLLQELLSGSLLAPPNGPGLRDPRPPEAPMHPEVSRLDNVSTLDLLLALGRLRTHRRDEDGEVRVGQAVRSRRIREARVLRPVQNVGASPEVLDTSIVVSVVPRLADMDGAEPPRFGVVGPDSIPVTVRRRMALALSDLWQRGHGRGPKQFFTRLSFPSTIDGRERVDPTRHPRRMIEELERQWEQRRQDAPHEVHDRLSELEREVADELGDAIEYRADVGLDHAPGGHWRCIAEALERAEKQVVMTVSDEDGLVETLVEKARAAADRGVTVLLLANDRSARDALNERLKGEESTSRGGMVVVATNSMASRAQVVVSDMDWAYVTGERVTTRRGVRVDARGPDLVTRAVSELLAWLRKQISDPRLRRLLLDAPVLFGRRVGEVEVLAELPEPSDGPFAKLWPEAWSHRVQEHRHRLNDALPLAVPVFDGAHRELLELAVKDAQATLLVASVGAGSSALPPSIAEGLVRASRRGVNVRVRLEAGVQPAPEFLRQRKELEAAGVRMADIEDPAGVLVCDDWCMVGSHRYLSPVQSSIRDVSVRIFGDDVVNAVLGLA